MLESLKSRTLLGEVGSKGWSLAVARKTTAGDRLAGTLRSRAGSGPDYRSMLADQATDAAEIEAIDRREVFAILPDFRGRSVLELGAGIGRFTQHFVGLAGRVLAVDPVAAFIEENRHNNGGDDRAEFLCADITELQLPACSFDLVFTNWLLMCLEDAAVPLMLDRIRGWLRPGGHLFVRESCHNDSIDPRAKGSSGREAAPATIRYRRAATYRELFAERFAVIRHGSVAAYVRYYQSRNQLYWLLARPVT